MIDAAQDPAKNGNSILAMDDTLKASDAYKVVSAIRSFSRSIRLFEGNYQELADQLAYFADAQRSFELEQAGSENLKEHFKSGVVRLIHNYVSASLSLVDHTRNHFKKLYENKAFPDYQSKLDEAFAKNPLAHFVKGLRQYFQHYELPDLVFTTTWRRDAPSFIRTVHLRKKELQKFEWNTHARSYIDSCSDEVDLTEIVTGYHDKVVEFYHWFQGRQQEIHMKEFEEVEAARAEMRRLAIPDILNGLLQMPDMDASSFEANLLRYIDEDEKILLALMKPSSKAEFLLVIFKSMAEISPAIENRMRALWPAATSDEELPD